MTHEHKKHGPYKPAPIKKAMGKKTIYCQVPAELHDVARKVALDNGMTVTGLVTAYFQYLRALNFRRRVPLNKWSKHDFYPDGGNGEDDAEDDDGEG